MHLAFESRNQGKYNLLMIDGIAIRLHGEETINVIEKKLKTHGFKIDQSKLDNAGIVAIDGDDPYMSKEGAANLVLAQADLVRKILDLKFPEGFTDNQRAKYIGLYWIAMSRGTSKEAASDYALSSVEAAQELDSGSEAEPEFEPDVEIETEDSSQPGFNGTGNDVVDSSDLDGDTE